MSERLTIDGDAVKRPALVALAIAAALASASCIPAYPYVETADRLCPPGTLARDYEGQVFIVGLDRARPDWGTYEPWTCLG